MRQKTDGHDMGKSRRSRNRPALVLDCALHWYLRKWRLEELESYFPNNREVQAEKKFW